MKSNKRLKMEGKKWWVIICMSMEWPVFLASRVQSAPWNESVSTHSAVKQRWQFCAFSSQALEGAVPFKLAFGYKSALQATVFLCRGGRVLCAAAPSLLKYSFALVCSLPLAKSASYPLLPSRHMGFCPSNTQTKLNSQFFFLSLSQYEFVCD